ncbi:MAG: glycosyltransferase family 4 protein [Patescibacteria group bacterium]
MLSFSRAFFDEKSDTLERHKKYAQWLRRRYPDGGLTVLVRVPKNSQEEKIRVYDTLNIYAVPCARWRFYFAAKKAIKELVSNGQRFDLITTQTPFDDGLVGVWAKKKYGMSFNAQMRSSFLDVPNWLAERPVLNRIFNFIGKFVSHRADTIRVISFGERERLERRFPELRGKIDVLHPYIQLSSRAEVAEGDRSRGISLDWPYFLFVGRLVVEKNLPFLLRAFQQFTTPGVVNCKLVMVGEGPLRTKLEKLAGQLGISDRVVWLGKRSLAELRELYGGAVATILPSFYEGFGKVIAESSLMGTPCVVTPFIPAKELVLDGKTGVVLESFNNENELAEKMRYLLENQDVTKKMGEEARRHIGNYLLSEEEYAKRLVEIWKGTTLLSSRKSP